MMKQIKKYLKIWWLMSKNSFVMVLSQKLSLSIFLIGKLIRFFFFFMFLVFLLNGANSIAGYSKNQVIFFYLTFTLIDVFSQFLFREVYRFRPQIVRGDFDYVLVKPVNALFRSLMGGADVIDFITIPPLLIAVIYYAAALEPTLPQILLYLALLLNGFIISAAFHIIVLSMAIITLEIDHAVMIYRDLTSLGRLPTDIYREPLKGFLTYLIPVGIMVTLPVRSLIGLSTTGAVITAFAVGILILIISIKFWNFALKKYSSASS
jgi:ABC-2 type transport system permease protein